MENYVGDIVTNMNHRSGVYDSPMAQDYYVRYLGRHLLPQPILFYNHYKGSRHERKVQFFLTLFKRPLTPPFHLNIMW